MAEYHDIALAWRLSRILPFTADALSTGFFASERTYVTFYRPVVWKLTNRLNFKHIGATANIIWLVILGK